jgi:hypothetical protein
MSKKIALLVSALMLAAGAAGAATAADAKKPMHVTHPRSQASLQCSAEANAKGLHGKARVAFRRDCLRKAGYHKATYHKAAAKKIHPATLHHKPEKGYKKT